MSRVAIGIHLTEDPESLTSTVASIAPSGSEPVEVIVLRDGPAAVGSPSALSEIVTSTEIGAPACFNRLVAATDAEVVVFLEGGCLMGAGCLDRLLRALRCDPGLGLVGPSTNRAWNEQRIPGIETTGPRDTAAVAARLAARYGGAIRGLGPLHSLGAFCYAVRREVVEAVGPADEGFGTGPCWEMEYTVRAARAGFRSGWVPGAYVHRPPVSARRAALQEAAFPASRRRYQDRVCGRRLRGEDGPYRDHCRGEACPEFAPPGLFHPRERQPRITVASPAPRVSCVMPTRGRTTFALQAIRLFQEQDHRDAELVIVDEPTGDLHARLPPDARLRYLRAPATESIGAKRNRACAAARGEVIVLWDDDDWYGPARVTAQVAPILAGEADVTALTGATFLDLASWTFWRCTPALHRRLFYADVIGGTLAFRRGVWERRGFPETSLAEDAAFLGTALDLGAHLVRVDAAPHFVYVRHGGNSWTFRCGTFMDPGDWHPVPEPPLPERDRRFLRGRAGMPLVSCILPTADRPEFVPLAVAAFVAQDYPSRELVVVDNGRQDVLGLIPTDAEGRIRVERTGPSTIGAARNLACDLARGDLIAHWDDDDWSAPGRLSAQVGALSDAGAELCGQRSMPWLEPAAGRGWRYEYGGDRPWVIGTTLCYRRSVWERTAFRDIQVGEDTCFVWGAGAPPPLVMPDTGLVVGVIHAGNTARKNLDASCWSQVDPGGVAALMGGAAEGYVRAVGGGGALAATGRP